MTEIPCIRSACIADPTDPYHTEEPHICYVCGYHFDVTPEVVEKSICSKCLWARCPKCHGCACRLDEHDQQWLWWVRHSFCRNYALMASIDVNELPETHNVFLKVGLGLQLRYCKKWCEEKLRA